MKEDHQRVRVIVIDDEQPARAIIREYLQHYPQIEVVGEAASGEEGIELINALHPDLIFLDIQMPGKSGFDLLEAIVHTPAVIFCTAYDHYAIEAFEVNAVDYLLKPFSRERFRQALDRVLNRPDIQVGRELFDLIRTWQRGQEQGKKRLFIQTRDRIVSIDLEDILWIEAAGDYSRIHTRSASLLCSEGLGEMERRLDPSSFIRIHRSTIIALQALHSLVPDGDGGYTAHLQNGITLRVSRSYGAELKKMVV